MFYCNEDKFGLTFDEVRRMYPEISFPANSPLTGGPVSSYEPTPTPDYDPVTHHAVEVRPVNGLQVWEVHALPPEQVAENQAAAATAAREQAKAERQATVDAIKVTTTSGHTFDGDETSQTRMARAILALQATGTPSVAWVLADNTVIQATAAELIEALALAGAAQAAVWVIE